jgi:hypothetical protein
MYSSLVRHINRFQDTVEWNYVSLSSHPYVTLITLKALKDKPWNWNLLTSHMNWNWNWVREFPEKPWNWRTISSSVYFTWDWVREFPEKPWVWTTLSEKASSIKIVKEFQDKPWDWYTLTLGADITIEDMVENPNFPWTINQLLFTDIDEDIIKFLRYYRSHYDVDAWCDHTARTPWKYIKNNSDLPWVYWFVKFKSGENDIEIHKLRVFTNQWNWKHISEMLDFKTVISKCMDLPWDFECVSKNKTVSYKDVIEYPEFPWNFNYIELNDEALEWNAANTIKKYWNRSVTDPSFSLCRKIVLGDLFGALDGRNHPCDDKRDD